MNRFMIPSKLPSYNEVVRLNRTHWSKGAELKREVEDIIGWSIVSARNKGELVEPKKYPCKICITFYEANKRRDVDNVVSSQKFIFDALQKFNILKNDSPKYVERIYSTVAYATDNYVEVEIL